MCSKNRSIGRTTAGRLAGSVSSKMTKPADGPMFPRRPADFIFRLPAGRRFSEFPPLSKSDVLLLYYYMNTPLTAAIDV